jgi:hypothetical protein
MDQQPRRAGRPLKTPEPGARASLGLKVTGDIKQRLDAAARANGRTQSQEAEARLERSFQDELLLPQLLDMAYGRQTAGLLLLIGECLRTAAPDSASFAGARIEAHTDDWMDWPWAVRQASEAIEAILEALEPPGTKDAPFPEWIESMPEPVRSGMKELGRARAKSAIAALFGGSDNQRLNPARERLASVVRARKGVDAA